MLPARRDIARHVDSIDAVSHVAACVGCSRDIGLASARPVIGADGKVALWCASCIEHGPPVRVAPEPIALAPEAVEPDRRIRWRRAVMPLVGVGVAFSAMLSTAAVTVIEQEPIHVTANIGEPLAEPEQVGVRVIEPTIVETQHLDEAPPPRTTKTETAEELDLDALEEDRPSLRDWVHPVTGSLEKIPTRGTRRFGAHRDGVSDPNRCGQGHCGVDLDGPRGRPIVAVAWGTVVRVEHSADGRDGRSGRYVRIEHPEGVFTSYMHLDAIEADIKVGDDVVAGQVVGTLGKTGIHGSAPHLHFGLEIQMEGSVRFVDPVPFLARAEVVPVPVDELRLTPEERSNW
jgi:murein DD-endopeptidase MepM/ murein hydrolase activator NlpD